MRQAQVLCSVLCTLFLVDKALAAESPFGFVTEYIREISTFENTRTEAEQAMKAKDADVANECIKAATTYLLELGTAVSILEGMHNVSATTGEPAPIIEVYKAKVVLYTRLRDVCQEWAAGPQPNVDHGKLSGKIPELDAEIDYADKMLFTGIPLVFATLIRPKPDEKGHMSRLVISTSERATLIREIDSAFGKEIKNGNQNYIVSSASVLRDLLTKKGYKCTDER